MNRPNARIADRNLRQRINYARYAAAPERRIAKSVSLSSIFPVQLNRTPLGAGREFVFFIRYERRNLAR